MSLVFDTLKLSKTLSKVFSPEQAEVLTEALTLSTTENLVTKADLGVEIATFRTELKGDIANLRADMIRWIVGAIAFNLFATAGLMFTTAKLVAQQ